MTRRSILMAAGAAAAASRLKGGYEIGVDIRFDRKLQVWDGFGVNYVEVAQTRDYERDPQEYGGFSTLSEDKRREILELTFGPDGLKPALLKMFLDCWHQRSKGGAFDHKTTTKWMRYYVKEGLAMQRKRGADLQIITTLYGPPAYMTKQKFVRGRDLDPAHKQDLCEYLAHWCKYLKEEEKFPVRYVGLHNEGEDFRRWPTDGSWAGYPKHDYNMYWHSSQVAEIVKMLRPVLDKSGLKDIGISPGETSSWDRFINWGYAWALAQDVEALRALGIITSHGFGVGATFTSMGVDLLRLKRPELHAWTTSMTWGQMDARFIDFIRHQIYTVKVNGVIPWATIQTDTWVGGDPNPGTAFRVDGKGGYTVEPGYYYFKQLSRAGQPGMAVAEVATADPDVQALAWASNNTPNPDALAVVHTGASGNKDLIIQVQGSRATSFEAFVTDKKHCYRKLGDFALRNGAIEVTLAPDQVITFYAKKS